MIIPKINLNQIELAEKIYTCIFFINTRQKSQKTSVFEDFLLQKVTLRVG